MTNQREGYVPETHLGQIKVEGVWLDYARGHRAESIRWAKADPANRRVVDWIHKERILWPTEGESVEFVLRTDGPDVTLSVKDGNVYLGDGTGSVAEIDGEHFTSVMGDVIRHLTQED